MIRWLEQKNYASLVVGCPYKLCTITRLELNGEKVEVAKREQISRHPDVVQLDKFISGLMTYFDHFSPVRSRNILVSSSVNTPLLLLLLALLLQVMVRRVRGTFVILYSLCKLCFKL